MKTEIIEENGVKYEKTIYDDGSYTILPWVDPDAPIPEPTPEPEEPTDTEMIMDAIATIYEAVLENKE